MGACNSKCLRFPKPPQPQLGPSLNFQSAQLRRIADGISRFAIATIWAQHVSTIVTDAMPLIIKHLAYQLNYEEALVAENAENLGLGTSG